MQPTKIVTVRCIRCERSYTLMVPVEGYTKWATGQVRIQEALPGLSAAERELLLSNICPDCWDHMFKFEE